MNVEFWNSVFQWASVALIAVTFFVGAGALWTGNVINKRQTERLVVLEKDLAVAQQRAAEAEIALAEIKERFKPRQIADDRRAALIAALKASPARGPVEVIAIIGDGEAGQFAQDFVDVLQAAGWPTEDFAQGALSGWGLLFTVKDLQAPPPHAAALQRIFNEAGDIKINGEEAPESDATVVRLLVMSKP